MPADHAHLAAQKLDTVREDHVLPVRAQAERHGGTRAGTPRTPARGSSPRRTGFSLHPGRIRRGSGEVPSGRRGAPLKAAVPGPVCPQLPCPPSALLCAAGGQGWGKPKPGRLTPNLPFSSPALCSWSCRGSSFHQWPWRLDTLFSALRGGGGFLLWLISRSPSALRGSQQHHCLWPPAPCVDCSLL